MLTDMRPRALRAMRRQHLRGIFRRNGATLYYQIFQQSVSLQSPVFEERMNANFA